MMAGPQNEKSCWSGLIKTLIEQTFSINNTWSGFCYDILNKRMSFH